MMSMNIQTPSKLNKALTKVSKHAETIGLAAAFLPYATANERGLGGAPQFVYDRILGWRFPDSTTIQGIKDYLLMSPETATQEWQGKGYIPFRYGIMAIIAAWGLTEFEIGKDSPLVKKLVALANKVGPTAAIYAGLSALVYVPAVAHASNPSIKEMITGQTDVPNSVKEVVATVIAHRGAF